MDFGSLRQVSDRIREFEASRYKVDLAPIIKSGLDMSRALKADERAEKQEERAQEAHEMRKESHGQQTELNQLRIQETRAQAEDARTLREIQDQTLAGTDDAMEKLRILDPGRYQNIQKTYEMDRETADAFTQRFGEMTRGIDRVQDEDQRQKMWGVARARIKEAFPGMMPTELDQPWSEELGETLKAYNESFSALGEKWSGAQYVEGLGVIQYSPDNEIEVLRSEDDIQDDAFNPGFATPTAAEQKVADSDLEALQTRAGIRIEYGDDIDSKEALQQIFAAKRRAIQDEAKARDLQISPVDASAQAWDYVMRHHLQPTDRTTRMGGGLGDWSEKAVYEFRSEANPYRNQTFRAVMGEEAVDVQVARVNEDGGAEIRYMQGGSMMRATITKEQFAELMGDGS